MPYQPRRIGLERIFVQHWLARYGSALLFVGLASALAVGIETTVQRDTIQLLYVLSIVGAAIVAGFGPAMLAALACFFSLNFFFIEPRYSFVVGQPEDLPQLAEFVILGLLIGALAAYARNHAVQAERRSEQTALLYHLSQAMDAETTQQGRITRFVTTAQEMLGLLFCAVEFHHPPLETLKAQAGSLESSIQRLHLPLEMGGKPVGILRVGLSLERRFMLADEPLLLRVMGTQLIQSLERARLAEAASHAHALQESDRLKSALLSSISHDLRTPLTTIRAIADELATTDVDWSINARRTMIGTLQEQIERLDRLVGNLLDLTRIRSGAVQPRKDWYALTEVVDYTLEGLNNQLLNHPITVDIPETLPLISLDFVLTERILDNLLLNAAAYSPPNTPIIITARIRETTILITVRDYGSGIASDDRERIFEPWYRAPTTADTAKGTGMGLSIPQGFIMAQGGTIWVDPTIDDGTQVCFTLPIEEIP